MRPGFLPPQAPGGPASAEPAEPAAGPEAPPGWAPPHRPDPDAPPPAGGRPTFVTGAAPTGPSSPMAIVAIVMGSLSIALIIFTLGLAFTLSIVLAGIALGMGLQVQRRVRRGAPGRPGQARAAVIVASIALALGVIAAIVWVGLESAGFTPEDLEQWLRDAQDNLERRQGDDGPTGDPA